MTYEKYNEIVNGATIWARATTKGDRLCLQKMNDLIVNEVRKENRRSMKDAPKRYKYVVIQHLINRGSRNYPDLRSMFEIVNRNEIEKVTDKYIITKNRRISTDYIVGFLT